jgi:LPPG:FO 2-phospho-L-lactate transferase
VSPIVGGAAVKGPAAKMLGELGREISARAVWRHYGALIDGIVLDIADAALGKDARADGMAALIVPTVMHDLADRTRLAQAVLAFADGL